MSVSNVCAVENMTEEEGYRLLEKVIAVLVGGLTPVAAYFLGIMPFLPLVPVIMRGILLYIISFDRTRKYGNYRAVVVPLVISEMGKRIGDILLAGQSR